MEKIIIYQVLPRLFSKKPGENRPSGTLQQNGCGKMNDFTLSLLRRIRANGYTHIWFTGLIEHATQTDYTHYGIACDNANVVKGKAGSPYAIKDYYDVDPDLAENVPDRMAEFEQLLERTHQAGLKLIMDFVPNHVARQYASDVKPADVIDLGEDDRTDRRFDPNNNFYYIPGETLRIDSVPGEPPYIETPAKATGNDRFDAHPTAYDWYETVKLNYGVDYDHQREGHFQPVPDTWRKMLDILRFWAEKGIDGFRCDMAEMVPCAFWGWAITQIKDLHPDITFIAEVYDPAQYRTYIHEGRFDYLYDKVGLYDTLRAVVVGQASTHAITHCWQSVSDIQPHMLNFLENHDEQRLASDFFAGDAIKGRPALVVSACMNTNPFMVYAGQEVGERGMDAEGFSGRDGRTTIFDYWSLASLRKIVKGEPAMSKAEKELYRYYRQVLHLARQEMALSRGSFFDLSYVNEEGGHGMDPNRVFAFLRHQHPDTILCVANFSDERQHGGIRLPCHAFDYLQIQEGLYTAFDLLHQESCTLDLRADQYVYIEVPAHDAVLLKFAR